MAISDDEQFRNGNSYRLHQDTLRWTLLAGYAAFLVAIIGLTVKPDVWLGISIVAIGICYMFILAVENFFYNLFSEYVKDCEAKRDAKDELRTLRQFAKDEAKRIGPFHHSFFFAMVIVLFGNIGLTVQIVCGVWTKILLYILNGVAFFLIFFLWRILVFPYFVLPLQRIFDVSLEERNFIWKLFNRCCSNKRNKNKTT